MDDLNTITGRRGRQTKRVQESGIRRCFTWLKSFYVRTMAITNSVLFGVILLVLFCVFKHFYYTNNDTFLVAPEKIIIRGSSTIQKDYILQCFGINEPVNGYQLVRSDLVQRVKESMPILKNPKISYTVGGEVELWVEERMPLARIAGDIRPPLVVDEDGVVFVYSRPATTYPEIAGFDLPEEEVMPGKVLPGQLHCMLRLLLVASDTTEFFPSAVKRVSLLGIDPEDGLKVTLVDGRKIDLAWDGMATETEVSEEMKQRLRNVARVLRSTAAEGKTHFNAMAPDRVTVSE